MSLPAHLSSPRGARVSIAMTTYNGARFIQEQLDSLRPNRGQIARCQLQLQSQ